VEALKKSGDRRMFIEFFGKFFSRINALAEDFYTYISNNIQLIFVLVGVTLAAYGFELFNFNITIDEEIAAFLSSPNIAWVSQGRWGMFILSKFLLPYNVIPFVPLFLALIFKLFAILLILNSLEVNKKLEQMIIGSIGMSFPGMAFIDTFSTLNYGVGFGLLCIALTLYIYVKNRGVHKFWAVIPAAFAISIYQGFIPALFSIFLLYAIKFCGQKDFQIIKTIINISLIILFSILTYYIIQKFIMVVGGISTTGYVEQFFEPRYFLDNFGIVLVQLLSFIYRVYSGDKSIYGIEIHALGCLLLILSLGIGVSVLQSKMKFSNKVFIILLSIEFILTPFVSGILTRGYLAMRFLVGLPVVITGWAILGLNNDSRIYKNIVALIAVFSVLQFITSTNHLFASSYLALQEDRLMASLLINRIEDAKAESGTNNLKYIEIIGYLSSPSTELITKVETFGASFFEWDQGNAGRILLFLQINYRDLDLQLLPVERRAQMIEIANAMPNWPKKGSVKIVGDTVLIKFGPYSYTQKKIICNSVPDQISTNFCK